MNFELLRAHPFLILARYMIFLWLKYEKIPPSLCLYQTPINVLYKQANYPLSRTLERKPKPTLSLHLLLPLLHILTVF